ncbi:MAG TPA: DsbA family protein [Caulobacteraceae bacterium]|jgi:protein-disulfide isomerase
MRAAFTRRLALTLAAGAALALAACQNSKAGGAATERSLGQADAPVTVVEYASTTCVHCATWDREVWPEFKKKYVDTGQVRYVLREMLTPPYEVASAGFLIASCAAGDNDAKYFDVIHALFRSQEEMQRTGDARAALLNVAKSAGMTEQQFQQCVSDEDQIVALQERVERFAKEDQVTGTPTFVVNGKKTEGVAMAQLDAAIQPLLKKRSGG